MKDRTRKTMVTMATTTVLLITTITPASAISGIGDIVYDPANYAENLRSALQGVQQVTNQIKQIENQFRELENQAKNLISDGTNIAGLKVAYQNLLNINNYINNLIKDYTRAQAAWDRTYPNFSNFNKLSALEYAQKVSTAWQKTNQALLSSATTNAIVQKNQGLNRATVNSLLAGSDNASGALAAAQIGHKFAAAQINHLEELKVVVAQSADAQAGYYRYKISKDNQAQNEIQSMKQLDNLKNPPTKGVGRLIP